MNFWGRQESLENGLWQSECVFVSSSRYTVKRRAPLNCLAAPLPRPFFYLFLNNTGTGKSSRNVNK